MMTSNSKPTFNSLQSDEGEHDSMSDIHSQSELCIIRPEEYPERFKEHHYDCCLIYSNADSDRIIAENFKDIIVKHLRLKNGKPPDVCILDRGDNLSYIQSRFKHSDVAIERSTFIFILLTGNSDEWFEMQTDECLMRCLDNREEKNCVIPLFCRDKKDINIPFGLQTVSGLNVSTMIKGKSLDNLNSETVCLDDLNKYDVKKLTEMFNQKLRLKLEREEKQKAELNQWIKEEQKRREQELSKQFLSISEGTQVIHE